MTPPLGTLSEKHETRHPGPAGAGVVADNPGDRGGVSYGSYQMAVQVGTPARFVTWLARKRSDVAMRLSDPPGSSDFTAAWKELADEDATGFFQLQHDFIEADLYQPALQGVRTATGLDVGTRLPIVRDALWSTAVQHGASGAVGVWKYALAALAVATVSDEAILRAVYAERGRADGTGALVHFKGNSPAIQRMVARRFDEELTEALTRARIEAAERVSPETDEPSTEASRPARTWKQRVLQILPAAALPGGLAVVGVLGLVWWWLDSRTQKVKAEEQ